MSGLSKAVAKAEARQVLAGGYFQVRADEVATRCRRCDRPVVAAHYAWDSASVRLRALRDILADHIYAEHQS